jgi:site-specific DNA recombinase
MKTGGSKHVRCTIYTRVSTDQGLGQDFHSLDAQHLDAQYDASQAYIRSQAHAGWTPVRSKYDDVSVLTRRHHSMFFQSYRRVHPVADASP